MDALTKQLRDIAHLRSAAAVLEWDQETFMPAGGNEARAAQAATLRRMAHELLTSDETAGALDSAEPESELDQDVLRVVREDLERASKLSAELVGALAEAVGHAKPAWVQARAQDDISIFEPHLARIVDLNVQKAEAIGFEDEPYDALLDEYEPAATTAQVSKVFSTMRDALVPMVSALSASGAVSDAVLHRRYPKQAQWDFGVRVMHDIGYDFECGRQDESAHPFTTTFAISDVRVTTRISEHHFSPAFFGSLHEAGHGMYEQGVAPALSATLLDSGTSLGMHESQSRLWENLVGRSRPFWTRYFPTAQAAFPATLQDVSATDFYAAVNRVAPSLIRVEADEVTYNLHIMVRFEIERDLVTGRLAPADLPDAWNARMQEYLGVTPESNAEGCLQDIHWSIGAIGYFPTYALGNLMSVQLWKAMARDLGDLDALVESGDFAQLLGWLRTNVHRYGRRKTASEILQEVTGSELNSGPWIEYARQKFGALYGISL